MLECLPDIALQDEDHRALAAACEPGVGLCTIVGIEGSFSRRLGAQLAITLDGQTIGSLADGCLEAQLAADMSELSAPRVIRYGAGSDTIDFRLPCGGGLDIQLDPSPNKAACRRTRAQLARRKPAKLALAPNDYLTMRAYIPSLHIVAFGEGPELVHLRQLAKAMPIDLDTYDKSRLSLGKPVAGCRMDRWSAALFLFHDHEWELPLLEQALRTEAFFIGAQGGENARIARSLGLIARGVSEEAIARIESPVGLISSCKSPSTLALSALAQIVGAYEAMRAAA